MPVKDPSERAALVQAVRAHLEFEQQMATPGLLPAPKPAPQQVQRPQQVVAAASTARASRPSADAPQATQRQASSRSTASDSPMMSGKVTQVSEPVRLQLAALAEEAAGCQACVLHEKRTQAVFARGNPGANLVFVGEGPGRDEDVQGLPFVGAAGKLLDRMIAAMGFGQDEIYICNVVKCRPPENRTPRPDEAAACAKFLHPQLALVQPQVIVALGRCAAEHLGLAGPSGPWRGRWGTFNDVPVLPTYHPAFLLRSPQFKKVVWQDLQQVMARFGRSAPP